MSYVIFKTDGTVLTTIADGTINTTSTPLALPGRLYAGYGQVMDTNIVHLLENFADNNPPAYALEGQLWYNLNDSTLYICPADGEANPANWIPISSTLPGANTQFGNIDANNLNLTNTLTANLVDTDYLTVNIQANIANANVTGNANIANLTIANITTGSSSTTGNLTGVWTVTGTGTANSAAGTAMWVTGGNLFVDGIKTDSWYYANGTALSFDGTYTNTNVASYLASYVGNVGAPSSATIFNGNVLSTGSNTTAGTLVGNWTLSAGSQLLGLANIDAANITGQVANALVASTVYTNAQPNITSVGTLTSLGVSGVVTASRLTSNIATGTAPLTVSSNTKVANLNADLLDGYDTDAAATPNTIVVRDNSGNVSANYIIGNGAFITGLSAAQISSITNGASNVSVVASSGNVAIAVGGLSNLALFSGSGLSVIGNISTGNISATRITGILATPGQPNITSVGTLTSLAVSGNVSAGNVAATSFVGSGASLTDLNASNLASGTVPSARLSGTYTINISGSATTAGTVFTPSQPNITSVGTLSSLTVSGNATAGNIAGGNLVSANFLAGRLTTAAQPNITSLGTVTGLTSSGNITAPYFIGEVIGNIVPGNIVIPGANTQVLFNNQGSIGTDSRFTFNSGTGVLTINGNVQGSRFIGNGSALSSITGANVTGTVANATYADSAGSALTAGSATSASTATTAGSATTAGTVTTAAQPNITSVGTLSQLTVSGNINATNLNGNHFGNGAGLTNINGANVIGTVASATTAGTATSATTAGSATSATTALTAGTVTNGSQPNITSVGTLGSLAVTGNINCSNVIATHYGSGQGLTNIPAANVNGTVANATYAISAGSANTAISADTANTATTATTATRAGTVTTNAQPNITSVGTMSFLIVTGNINSGNVIGTHYGSGAGLTNIPGGNVVGAVPLATNVSAIPSGTRMLFVQSSAPTGWTKITSSDNAALRVVSGGAGSGGSVDFTSAFSVQGVSGTVGSTAVSGTVGGTAVTGDIGSTATSGTVGDTTLTIDQIPPHDHSVAQWYVDAVDDGGSAPWAIRTAFANTVTGSTGGGQAHTHSFTGSTHTHSFTSPSHSHGFTSPSHNHSFSGGSINLSVKYVDAIIAQKD